MAGKARYTFKDFSGQSSAAEVYTATLTAGNIAATLAALTTLENAIEGLSLGNLTRRSVLAVADEVSNANANDAMAARELKWLVIYTDDVTGKSYSLEIPCAKLSNNTTAGTEFANLSSANWSAFVTAFEVVAKSPDGNDVTVVSSKKVGRNI